MMRLLAIMIILVHLFCRASIAQSGLEGIVIETYYISHGNDSGSPEFPLPAGAKTYRVFVDMASNWGLQAIFGATNVSTGEVDTLIIRSTQPFFNNEGFGSAFGYSISTSLLDENTVLLDSWLTTGRSSNGTAGVLKPDDTNGGAPAFPNVDGLLQNDDPGAGIPITTSDGNIPFASTATWTLIGLFPSDFFVFENVDLAGDELVILDGAMTSFTTLLQGPNASNRVLVGQFTTAGEFSGQLNLQLRNMVTGEIQQWVAETPGSGQFTSPSLKWEPNHLPIVNITSPATGTRYTSGVTVDVSVEANDTDGTITEIEFFFNGISMGVDNMAPYEIAFTAIFNGVITAVATDDADGQTTSAPVLIEVNPYKVRSVEQLCNLETVCMPIEVIGEGIDEVVGFDIVLTFDNTKVIPTGNIFKNNDLVDLNFFSTDYNIDLLNQRMLITVFMNNNAPIGTTFSGIGDLICIEFSKRPAFSAEDSCVIWMTSLLESFSAGGFVQRDSIASGVFSTVRNTTFLGSLAFWADNSPIVYDVDNPTEYLISNITGMSEACDSTSATSVHPDLSGAFTHNLNDGVYLSIDRDIEGTTDVQAVINSFDAFLVRKILLDDPTFDPSIFQVIAMDVNLDGVISAGDLSQINQRSLLIIDEFRQAWNYHGDGTPMPNYEQSKDWLFISDRTLLFDPAYSQSSSFPLDDGIGYSKYRVPQVPFCIWTEIDILPYICPDFGIETYYGILIGDVNGNYRYQTHDGRLKSRGHDISNPNHGQARFVDNK